PPLERSLPSIADIQVDADGDIYFLDTIQQKNALPQSRIRIITPAGQLQTVAVLPDGQYSGPMTIDAAGNLYTGLTNGFNYAAILRIAPDGTISTVYQKTTIGENSATLPGQGLTADAA